MPLSNKIKNCPKKIVVDPIQIPEPILTVQATAAPVPRAKRGRPRKNQSDPTSSVPPEPTSSKPPASFPVPVAKKARKPRAKKISSELLEQVPVQKKGKAKQKVQVEVEVEPVITVKKPKKPRLTKSQKLAQEEEEASESEDASGSEETEEIDSDEELDRAIDRLAKIKALQSD